MAEGEKQPTAWEVWKANGDANMAAFVTHVSEGGHMADYCRAHKIDYVTMMQWVNRDPERAKLYARAREDRADKLADEIVDISDETEVAAKYEGESVKLALDANAIQRNRLRVDARKWVAAKLKPRSYGDKLDLTAEIGIKGLPDEALDAEIARLTALLAAKSGPVDS